MKPWPEPASRLTVSGPKICPTAKADVITPTASEAGAPPSRNASLMPAMVMTMKVPPTQIAESSKVAIFT